MFRESEFDERFMRRAIDLARSTVALASPNPRVGCVLTRPVSAGPVPIGEGAHLYAARDHAEIAALKQAEERGHDPAGSTAYVTLEPCAHHGRTPPCADALIAAGVSRVVVATQDPNPLVAGEGLARLRAAGIAVHVGTLRAEARRLNDAWAFSILHGRPCVTLKAALSADGYLAPPPGTRTGEGPFWLTGPAARAQVHELRHRSDAILTGIGTVLADNPLLTDRSGRPRRRPLLRVVLDPLARTPVRSAIVQSAEASSGHDLLIFAADEAPNDRVRALRSAGAEVLTLPTLPEDAGEHRRHRFDLHAALVLLQEGYGSEGGTEPMRSVLLETGSALNGAFLAAGLVDQLALFYSKRELGAGSVPFARGMASPFAAERQLTGVVREEFCSPRQTDVLVTGYLHDPWA